MQGEGRAVTDEGEVRTVSWDPVPGADAYRVYGLAEHRGSSITVTFDRPMPRDLNDWIIHLSPTVVSTPCQAFAPALDTGPPPSEMWGWSGYGHGPETWLWDSDLGLWPAPPPPAPAIWGPSYAALITHLPALRDGWWWASSASGTFYGASEVFTYSTWRDYVPPPPPPPRDRDWRRRGPPPRFAENRAGL